MKSPLLHSLPMRKPPISKMLIASRRSCLVDVCRTMGKGCLSHIMVLGIAAGPAPLRAAGQCGFCDHALMTVTLCVGNGMADWSLSVLKSE